MSAFDLEQGKLSIRISESVYCQILADVEDFNFRKTNGEKNLNAFMNQLLPNLILYRIKKRKSLRSYLEKYYSHCIIEQYKEKVFNDMDDLFDKNYFDDILECYHERRLHFRLNKSNIIKLQDFFNELTLLNENKTTYLRNLLNEYADMRKDKREEVCFQEELDNIELAIQNKVSIYCYFQDQYVSLVPIDLILSYKDNSIYLIALDPHNLNRGEVMRFSLLKNISIKNNSYPIDQNAYKKISQLFDNIDCSTLKTFDLNIY